MGCTSSRNILEPDHESQQHAFRSKVFKKPRPCNLCHLPIQSEGSSCRVCKYVCHKSCEEKVREQFLSLF
ncbi:hypothetical protein O3M35_004756 [Rhynocoris fuscipes]|uniref:Phorbol-ester/DAG-type domain-containing protein n=1 Tax=Rhynocoris fuscipes TaxID=488301 RepID=A0AAW1DIG9_9HEMI